VEQEKVHDQREGHEWKHQRRNQFRRVEVKDIARVVEAKKLVDCCVGKLHTICLHTARKNDISSDEVASSHHNTKGRQSDDAKPFDVESESEQGLDATPSWILD